MIKDNRPFYIRLLVENFYKFWTKRFVEPQFYESGNDLDINKPWNLDIYGNNIFIGNNVHLRTSRNNITHICSWNRNGANAEIRIGDNVLISPGVRIIAAQCIEIEENVMIVSNVYITDSDWHDTYDRIKTPGPTKRVLIKKNSWIGEGSKISKGVTIGENSIIGLGSVVVSDVPNNKIYAGNPAREIKSLEKHQKIRTRSELFESNNYQKKMKYLLKKDLQGNNFMRWIRTILNPKKGD